MKQLFILLTIALLSATTAKAQTAHVAALNHEGTTTFFQGDNALANAHAAAVHGDEIILSEGIFPDLTVTKAVTIRGAGFRNDDVYVKTEISGITINITDSTDHHLTLEGIYCPGSLKNNGTLHQALFEKCFFNYVFGESQSIVEHAEFLHCYISTRVTSPSNSRIDFHNCVIQNPHNSYESSQMQFLNCVCIGSYSFSMSSSCNYCSFLNCVFSLWSAVQLASTCMAHYCVVNNQSSFFSSNIVNSNNTVAGTSYLFSEFPSNSYPSITIDNTYTYNGTKTGQDGTIVGIYGGKRPFTHIPSTRRIKSYAIDQEADANNKLGVTVTMK